MTTPNLLRAGSVLLAATLCLPAAASYRHADIVQAKVLRADPIVETYEVEVPREVCRQEQVRQTNYSRYDNYGRSDRYSAGRSRTPGVVGAIIGGAIGHSVGHGKKNKKIGTAVGAVLGGTIGADISRRNHERRANDRYYEGQRPVRYRTERVCEVVSEYRTEERISGYDVSYAYGGQTYATVLDRDPGRFLDVSVAVTPVE